MRFHVELAGAWLVSQPTPMGGRDILAIFADQWEAKKFAEAKGADLRQIAFNADSVDVRTEAP